MVPGFLESIGALLAVITPLVAVPLTVITFYLRSLRENQVSRHQEMVRRFEAVEKSNADIRGVLAEFQRDYTTKEEWLRECMHARRRLDVLSESSVRIEETLKSLLRRERTPDHGTASYLAMSTGKAMDAKGQGNPLDEMEKIRNPRQATSSEERAD